MRIIQALGWYYPDSLGGTEVYVAGLCRRLQRAGHDVLVAAPDPQQRAERTYTHDGVPVYRYPIPATPTRDESQGVVTVRGAERFHAWLRQQRADVVHVHTFVTGLGLAELSAAKTAGARVFVTTHASSLGYVCQRGTMMRWGTQPCDGLCRPVKCAACALQQRGLPQAVAWALAALPSAVSRPTARLPGKCGTALGMRALIECNQARQRRLLATVDRFVLLTRWASDAVIANGAPSDRVALNRLGMSLEQVVGKPDPQTRPTTLPVVVGYLGRFDAVKGVDDLARAVVSLPRDVPVQVEMRGPLNGAADQRVIEEVRRIIGADSRVSIAPAIPTAEVPATLARYDVLCCPAVCVEGGPTVAIEAHAVGTPVIGTRIGGLAELVTDDVNGRLVPPRDWRALAQVLAAIARDPTNTIDRWRRCLPRPRTMDEVAADYLALYAA